MSDPHQAITQDAIAEGAAAEGSLASQAAEPESARAHGSSSPDSAVGDTADERRPLSDDRPQQPIDEASRALALAIAEAADDRKAGDITILQTGDVSYLADYFVIVTGFSNVQVRAIANSIDGALKDKYDRHAIRTEGMSEGRWVLKDYGEVIVHIFMPTDREYYDLEAFWGHAERIPFTPTSALTGNPAQTAY